ncbi:MAG: oligosaccharide flippase family protein [Ignavibacteriae bacterium]|nr:oligosaccharide flippase family protein [Ignavibacteriota bacterium]
MINHFLKAAGWVLSGNLISKIINFLTLSILARFLGPSGLGVYNAVMSSTTSINQISDFGTSIVLQKESAKISAKNKSQIGSLFITTVIVQLVINALICAIILIWPEYFFNILFKELGSIDLLYFSVPIILFQCIAQLALTFLVGLGEFKFYSIRLMMTSIINVLVLALILYILTPNPVTALTATIISVLLNIIITWYLVYIVAKKQDIRFKNNHWVNDLKQIKKDGFIYYVGNTLVGAIVTIVLVKLFAKHISLEDYGYLRIGSSLAAILGIIPAAIQPVTINFLSKDNLTTNSLKSVQIRFFVFSIILITILILLFLNPIISILFGSIYLIGKELILFLVSIQIIILTSGIISNFLVASGHTSFIGVVSTFSVLVNLILSIILIPKFGIYGFYIAHFAGYFLGFVALCYKEVIHLNFILSVETKYMIGLYIFSILALLPIFLIESFIVVGVYGFLLIISMLFLFYHKVMKQNEKIVLLKLLQR